MGIGLLYSGLNDVLGNVLFYGILYYKGPSIVVSINLQYSSSSAPFLAVGGFLLIWATIGGLTVLRHYSIRLLLARSRIFPWRTQAFLDNATACILMRRVGGGYGFIHRRLLDYFADIGTAEPLAETEQAIETDTSPQEVADLQQRNLLPNLEPN